jgi:type III pantothenate kinase
MRAHGCSRLAVRATEYLLVDISNSFTKAAPATPAKVGRTERFETAHLTSGRLRRLINRWRSKSIIVSSVVPARNAAVARAAGRRPLLFIDEKADLGVMIDYPKPSTIGADRLANAAAAAELFGYLAIVVDFGTAVTFDVVSNARSYIGGVIAPGLEAMTSFLYQRTALLPKLQLAEPRNAVGRTTREAMLSGAVHGYRGLVREILLQIQRETFPCEKVRVIATGGYAELIARQMPEIDAVRPKLTLEGLRIVANRTFREGNRA